MVAKSHTKVAVSFTASCALVASVAGRGWAFSIFDINVVPALWLISCSQGGLLADIDKENTTMRKLFKSTLKLLSGLSIVTVVYLIINQHLLAVFFVLVVNILLLLLNKLVSETKHRRETHSFSFVVIIYLTCYFMGLVLNTIHPYLMTVSVNLGIGLSLGVLSHILIDQCNILPMHLFYPLDYLLMRHIKRKYRKKVDLRVPTIFKIVTGSREERSFVKLVSKAIPLVACVVSIAIIVIRFGSER